MFTQRTLVHTTRVAKTAITKRCLHSTSPLLQAAAREEHAAHTATQRVRFWIKSLPIETYPLFVVMGFSLSFGIYSFVRPALQDPTLRLKRSIARATGGGHH